MENTQLIIIVVGLLAALGLVDIAVLAYFNRKLAESALAIAGPALLALRNQGEVAVVQSGVDLSFLHNFLMLIKPHIDQPTDRLIRNLSDLTGLDVQVVSAFANKVWSEAEDFTDGEIEPETADISAPAGAARQ